MKFEDKVAISAGFKRSINLSDDQSNADVLSHYICPPSSEVVLASMCQHIRETGQAAFTWTGPYGSGKSSLALFLSALVSEREDLYQIAANKLVVHQTEILETFSTKQQRLLIPVVASPEDPIHVIAQALKSEATPEGILNRLDQLAAEKAGLILFIDEMGKFLERSASERAFDVYILQQIAEHASRSNGRIVFVGILHQSIAEYSRNLPKAARDEWVKIQGRFVDLAINAAGEEQIALVAKAIVSDEKPKKISKDAKVVAKLIAKNRPVNEASLAESLNDCWPLHPLVAALLGPVSRKRFGQNQRSIFSFLSSAEPYAFQFFLKQYEYNAALLYTPALYWDYLQANFESTILASLDAKGWIVAVEAINRATVAGTDDLSAAVMKTIAVIDLFKGTSGVAATHDVLTRIFPKERLAEILKDLEQLSLIRLNKHTDSYALYEGSDFNLDEELDEAYRQITDVDFQKLNSVAQFKPVVAKKHYHQTGAMRWMDVQLVPANLFNKLGQGFKSGQAFGEFLILMPRNEDELAMAQTFVASDAALCRDHPRIIGVAAEYVRLMDYAREMLALEWLKKNSAKLGGDQIARKEIESRHHVVASLLSNLLESTLSDVIWFRDGVESGLMSERQRAAYCSVLADEVFEHSPVLKTEMLNRNKPSGNANAALNALLKRMVNNEGEERLGIEGYPAEGGIFKILLEETGLYAFKNGQWAFSAPDNDQYRLAPLWQATDALLQAKDTDIDIKEVYQLWESAPFGIKKGLHVFLMATYLLTKVEQVAVYLNGTFFPTINDLFIDYLIKSTSDIRVRYVSHDQSENLLLNTMVHRFENMPTFGFNLTEGASSLEVARALVMASKRLNPWVMRTKELAPQTLKLREALKRAEDPNKLLFDDIPAIFNSDSHQAILDGLCASLTELFDAYPLLIEKLGRVIMAELHVSLATEPMMEKLRARAKSIHQQSGDFRVDALTSRLATFDQTANAISGIASLAVNKPINDWIDLDVKKAEIEIAVLCEGFRKAELYADVKDKSLQRHVITLTSGLSGSDQVHQMSVDVSEDDRSSINEIKQQLLNVLQNKPSPELILAAITEVGVDYISLLQAGEKEVQ
ncbi:MAG: hypothetical protein KBC57_07605 [Neisseriaceae bacterium]|nr:hypothetical protein [Neisseriaceae bacterium]